MWKRSSVIARILESIKFLLKYHSVENTFLWWPFQVLITWNEASLMPCFLMKSNTYFMTFPVEQVKYVDFLHRLIWHTAAAYVYVSPRPSWLILGAIPALGHVLFILLHFKKRNEMKWKLWTKENKENFQKIRNWKLQKLKN